MLLGISTDTGSKRFDCISTNYSYRTIGTFDFKASIDTNISTSFITDDTALVNIGQGFMLKPWICPICLKGCLGFILRRKEELPTKKNESSLKQAAKKKALFHLKKSLF